MKNSLSKSIFYNMSFQFFATVLPIVTTPYISRILGVEKNGLFSFVDSIVTIIVTVGSVGTFLHGCRKISYVRDSSVECKKSFNEILLLRLLLLFTVLILYIPIFCIISSKNSYYIIFILVVVGSLLDISWYFNGIEEFKKISIRNFVIKILFVISTFVFVKTQDDLYIYILLVGLNCFLGNICMWFCLPKGFINLKKIDYRNLLDNLNQSLILFIPQTANYIYTLSDRSMIGIITNNLSYVGIYDYAQKIIKIVVGLLQSIGYVILSRISNLKSQNNDNEIKKYIYMSINFTLWLAIPMMFGLICISKKFIPIFLGQKYFEVTNVIYMLSPLIIITSMNSLLGIQLMLPLKMDVKYMKCNVIGAVLNVFLNLLTIGKFKIAGACFSSLLSETFILILQFYYVKNIISLKKILKENLLYFVTSILCSIISIIVSTLTNKSLFAVFIQVFLFIIVYYLILLLKKDIITNNVKNILLRRKI